MHCFKATSWKSFPRAPELQPGVQTDSDPWCAVTPQLAHVFSWWQCVLTRLRTTQHCREEEMKGQNWHTRWMSEISQSEGFIWSSQETHRGRDTHSDDEGDEGWWTRDVSESGELWSGLVRGFGELLVWIKYEINQRWWIWWQTWSGCYLPGIILFRILVVWEKISEIFSVTAYITWWRQTVRFISLV